MTSLHLINDQQSRDRALTLLHEIFGARLFSIFFCTSPVSLASRDQGGSSSDSAIDIYDLTEK